VKYENVRLADEQQFSVYNFESSDVQSTWRQFELAEIECKRLIDGYWMATKGDESCSASASKVWWTRTDA